MLAYYADALQHGTFEGHCSLLLVTIPFRRQSPYLLEVLPSMVVKDRAAFSNRCTLILEGLEMQTIVLSIDILISDVQSSQTRYWVLPQQPLCNSFWGFVPKTDVPALELSFIHWLAARVDLLSLSMVNNKAALVPRHLVIASKMMSLTAKGQTSSNEFFSRAGQPVCLRHCLNKRLWAGHLKHTGYRALWRWHTESFVY